MLNMKAQDVLIALKIVSYEDDDWRIIDIAYNLRISASEVHAGIKRMHEANIMHLKKHIVRENLLEFIIHGVKYAFPAVPGMESRGIPTMHNSGFFPNIISDGDAVFVWPYENGSKKGSSIKPLYKSVPRFVLEDAFMYKYLAYIDAIRIGRDRERLYAIGEFEKLLG